MRVVLFNIDWSNLKHLVIGLCTLSKVSHAGLLFKGDYKVYDASESRGNVDYGEHIRKWGARRITVYEIPEDETEVKKYALEKKGTRYDYAGLMGWPFNYNDAETVFCFEFVLQVLLTFKKINGYSVHALGHGLEEKLFKTRIDSDDIYLLLERARLTPVYRGLAKEYA